MQPSIQTAAEDIINKVHAYMREHPESELHRCGKMFGVLIVEDGYLAAFSAKLDGMYNHEGFVPPVCEINEPPVGTSKEESRRLQRLLFANYNFINGRGEHKNLLDIFANEKPIVPPDEWFADQRLRLKADDEKLPPAGAGECCAPKLLQYALTHGLKPISLAEFWIGASPKNEIRREGVFYPPCSGRCVPILRHMMQNLKCTIYDGQETKNAVVNTEIEKLYEDDYLIVINKPSGLLSVPGKGDEPSAQTLLHAKPVHRLDQDTSGLLVLAKTPEVYSTLQSYFQRRDILKRYEAVLKPLNAETADAALKAREGIIALPLLPNPYDRPRQMVDFEHGKPAVTRYTIRSKRPDGTLFVDFYPLTGRTHQLRIHAAHPDGLNAPIVGDRLYGQITMENRQSERLMLLAAEITFLHPVTKKEMHFCLSPLS